MYTKAIDESRNLGVTDTFKLVIRHALEVGHVYFLENIFEKELGISPPDTWGEFNKQEQFHISYTLAIFYLMNHDIKGKEYFEFLRNFINVIISNGTIYSHLNKEINKNAKVIDIYGYPDKYSDDCNKKYRMLESDSPFYIWSRDDSFLKENISTFNIFLRKQLELKPNSKCINLLKSTSTACVRVQEKKDIEKELTNLSSEIGKFIEVFY